MEAYKYYLSLTSQMPFCSVPLRLDSYNKCQFACTYCFAKARGGAIGNSGTKTLDTKTLANRLRRVGRGQVSGATDEFLARRIPIQFGGMTDPFSPWEKKSRISLEALSILAEHQYPTIISTKSTLVTDPEYLELLAKGNFYVRISFTGVSDVLVQDVERGVPTSLEKLEAIQALSNAGVPVSMRLQPIIPGYERDAEQLVKLAGSFGAKHVSAEYLKLPVEISSRQYSYLKAQFPDLTDFYKSAGARKLGREFVLPVNAKLPFLLRLREIALGLGLKFGFAENELLHLNNFKSCCNGADLFLNAANFFDANILGMVKNRLDGSNVEFGLSSDTWVPTNSMLSHFNSRSRGLNTNLSPQERWIGILREKWNSQSWRGGPASFLGVKDIGEKDKFGNRVYEYVPHILDT